MRIDVADDLAYELVVSRLSCELRLDIEASLVGCLRSMGMACPSLMNHFNSGEF